MNLQVPNMGKVYNRAFKVQEHIDSFSDCDRTPQHFLNDVAAIFRSRWDAMHTPLRAAGYALDPEFAHVNDALICSFGAQKCHVSALGPYTVDSQALQSAPISVFCSRKSLEIRLSFIMAT
jgi:hypothetical protein